MKRAVIKKGQVRLKAFLRQLNNGGLLHMKIFTPAETEIIPVTTDVLTSSKNNDVIEIEEDLETNPIQGEQF